MNKVFKKIENNPIFSGIDFTEFDKMLTCLSAWTKDYVKDEVVLMSGNKVDFIGLILSGSIQVIKEDIDGRISILNELGQSEIFGEVFACAGICHSPVTVIAVEDSEILFLDYKKVISTCSNACPFHSKLIENMLRLIAEKSLMLNQKIEILSKRTTREKLRTFLDIQRGTAKKVTVPYNREELAQYLCVDRSAMSNELSKMRDEGLLLFNRNYFEILY